MIAYRLLRAFLRFLTRVFYRQIDVVGLEHVPAEGPVIFAGNHPNSLHDPMLIIAYSGRIVHFAAKDTLFHSRFMRFFLHNLGAVPVARKADHGDGADNSSAFDAMFAILGQGRAMGIFPEGLSHDEAQLAKLKTGAARIALGLAAKRPDLTVRVVPSGLVYVRPKRFRSRVLLQFGPPLTVTPEHLVLQAQDPREASRAFTQQLDVALRALTVNAEDWDTVRVLDAVRRLYQPKVIRLEQRAELTRRFNAVYPTIKDEPTVRAIYARMEAWLDRLRNARLSERDLDDGVGPWSSLVHVARHLALMFLWIPLAVPGLLVFVPAILSTRFLGPRVSPRRDVIATTKLVLGMVLSFGGMLAITAAVGWWQGPLWGALALMLLWVSFFATLRVLERGNALQRLVVTLVRLLTLRRELAELRQERAELRQVVTQAVERYRPPEMAPLFPAEAPLLDASDNLL
jgi:glycerol-3-phosphate O-acyltransferase/dihydroxyacetone phosphate acyltransferase